MSHEINVSKGMERMFTVGEPAWHGLGQVLDNPANAEEAIQSAGLDFDVELKPVLADLGDDSNVEIPNKFASVRMDTKDVLGVVGNKYTVLQNRDAFKFFDPIIDRKEAIYHSAGVLGKGERVWIMAKLPEMIHIGGHDEIQPYVTVLTNHDGNGSVRAFIHQNAIVCNNTLQAAIGQNKGIVNIRHTKSLEDRLEEAHKVLGIANMLNGELESIFQNMASKQITVQQEKTFVEKLFPVPVLAEGEEWNRTPANIKYREEVLESIASGTGQDIATRKGTAFGLYNGVTHWLDHTKNYRNDSNRLESIWFGNSANVRQSAFQLANGLALN